MNNLYNLLQSKKNIVEILINIANQKGYTIFKENNRVPHNYNLWGIRSSDEDTSKYNDAFIIFYEERKGVVSDWKYQIIEGTTDPSDTYLFKPINSKGTMILPEGQYRSLFKIGYHKGQYKALVQNIPVGVYRDNNKDSKLDLKGSLDKGMHGLNMHHASKYKIIDKIGLYSAGCQVVKDINDWNNKVLSMIKYMEKENQKTITYTLINQDDLL